MSRADDQRRDGRTVPGAVWLVVLAAPVAWALFTSLAWVSPEPACRAGGSAIPVAAVATALGVALRGIAGAGRALARRGSRADDDSAGFVVAVGLLVGALLVVGLVIAGTYTVLIDPCW